MLLIPEFCPTLTTFFADTPRSGICGVGINIFADSITFSILQEIVSPSLLPTMKPDDVAGGGFPLLVNLLMNNLVSPAVVVVRPVAIDK